MVIRNVTVNDCTPETIVIGRRGTFETMQVVFDLTYLIDNYGDGTAVLALKRSQDSSAYPAVAAQDGNTLTWVVSEVDTYYVGAGVCQLMWYVDDGLAKTIIYPMVVMKDILSTAEEPPDGYENWIEHLTDLGAETLQNAQNAAQSASEAETAKDDAVDAKEASEEAARKAEAASVHAPVIVNGYWYAWDTEAEEYQNTGVKAEGRDGEDGYSPSITVDDIPGGHRVTITDKDGEQIVDVMNGTNGDDGYSPAVTITGITDGHRVTITDKTHPTGQSFDVLDGASDAGSVTYDPTVTYPDGSVGKEVSNQKNAINDLDGSKPFCVSSNLIDPSKVSGKGEYWVAGVKYVDSGTTGNTSKMVSVKMPCEAETTYYNALYNISNNQRVNNSNVTYLNYFEDDGTYISWESCPFVQVNGVYQGRFTTPSGTGYVMITYVAYENGTDTVPYRKALCQDTPVPNTYVEYTLYDLHSAKNEIESLAADTIILAGNKEIKVGTSFYQQNGGVIQGNGTWGAAPDSTSYMHLVIPCTADFTLFSVTTVASKYIYITAVTDYVRHTTAGDPIQNMTSYWFKTVEVGAGKTVSGLVPKDAKYLLVTSKGDGDTIANLTITNITNPKNLIRNVNKISMGAFNVRDFGDGTTDGCPASLVSEKLPLWKDLISKWLNTDFVNIVEWRTKFDEGNTIDAYSALFEQFFPYKYEVISNNVAIQCIMSKYECVFTDLSFYGDVNRLVPMLITIIGGKSVAVVGWLQSATDTVANREKAYRNAATMLGTFDVVVLGGDFNTEVGLEELEELTNRGYTLGNGGYWGVINTWPASNPATPNDNIASKGCIFELFETNENHITSDHLPVRAKFTL